MPPQRCDSERLRLWLNPLERWARRAVAPVSEGRGPSLAIYLHCANIVPNYVAAMSSFWFFIGLLMLGLNAAWWVVAMRLTERRPWRVFVSVFMAGQLAAHLAAMAGVDLCPIPKAVIVPIIIWHRMGLIFALAILLVIGVARARVWMV